MKLKINAGEEIANVENALRNVISIILKEKLGNDWFSKSGLSKAKVERAVMRKDMAVKQHPTTAEERIIYYTDLFDLKDIIHNQWSVFEKVFIDKGDFNALWHILEKYRKDIAHSRNLFPNEKQLVKSVAQALRSAIVMFRSKNETTEDYFPTIESIRNDLGSSYTMGEQPVAIVRCGAVRVGQKVTHLIQATDPKDRPILYRVHHGEWLSSNEIEYTFKNEDIGKGKWIQIAIKVDESYHAHGDNDDFATFSYDVLPIE